MHAPPERRSRRRPWLRILGAVSPRRRVALAVLSFVVPLLGWCLISYVPFIWHPMMRVERSGDASWFSYGELVDADAFGEENTRIAGEHGQLATGVRANPVFLPGCGPTPSSCRSPTPWRGP